MTPTPRTYGGWRQARGIGLFGLGTTGTLTVFAVVIVLLTASTISFSALLILLGPAAIVIASCVLRWQGAAIGSVMVRRLRWWMGSLKGQTSYRAGIVVDHPRAWQLPGVLAPTRLVSAEDGHGGHYGIVWDRRTGMLTATIKVAANSTWLADASDAETWVANWGAWLADLGYTPAVRWVSVTVSTAPDPGSTLADAVGARANRSLSPQAVALLQERVRISPAAAADVHTWVAISFDPNQLPHKPKDLDSAVAEFGRALHGLQSSLSRCGVTVLGRASAAEIAGFVRTAFDPAARGEINRIVTTPQHANTLLTWADAGPVSAEEARDHYLHDSGTSVTWGWFEAPRQHVHANVLATLLAPSTYPKRITMLYRPYPAGQAAKLLESQVNAAAFRSELNRRQRKDPTARDIADGDRARRAAEEEATGAGVCLVSLYVTVTCTDAVMLPTALADIEARADTAKIRLRRLYDGQAAGFAATLPCGICPPALARRWPR